MSTGGDAVTGGDALTGLFSYGDFFKMILWLVLKLEISYNRVIIS